MSRYTHVTITIAAIHRHLWEQELSQRFRFCHLEPDDTTRNTCEYYFDDWKDPASEHFHVDSVPFYGYHGSTEDITPGRLCGDGQTHSALDESPAIHLRRFGDGTWGLICEEELHDTIRAETFHDECIDLIESSPIPHPLTSHPFTLWLPSPLRAPQSVTFKP